MKEITLTQAQIEALKVALPGVIRVYLDGYDSDRVTAHVLEDLLAQMEEEKESKYTMPEMEKMKTLLDDIFKVV